MVEKAKCFYYVTGAICMIVSLLVMMRSMKSFYKPMKYSKKK